MFYSLISILFFLIILPSNLSAHSQTQVIEMTASGFKPQSITVDENSTVIFINKDSEDHWPASNVHPTHELYPQFDPKKPIKPGESWTFKPKIGEWKYHDHLLPHQRGTITVVAEAGGEGKEQTFKLSLIDKINDFLDGLINRVKSIFSPVNKPKQVLGTHLFLNLPPSEQINTLKDISKSNGAKTAWEYIKGAFKGQAGSSGNIHDLAHLSGSLTYDIEGFNGIGICTAEFAFGCFHGFLDSAFKNNLDHLLDAEDSCLKLEAKNGGPTKIISGPVASCIHGIGHGVASFYSSSDLKKSLSTCRKLESGREYCFDGVFMEFVRSAPDSFFKKEDLLYPCNELEKEFGPAYSFACGRNQPSLLMGRFNLGYEQVINICLNFPSKPFQEACFDSLGFSLASTTDTEKIVSGCKLIGNEEYIIRCLKAAAGELVFQEVPGWEEKGELICNSFFKGSEDCLAHIDRIVSEYNRTRKINFTLPREGEDINTYVRGNLKICFDNGGRDGCYKQVALVLYEQFGLSQTLSLLKENEGYTEVYARCHEVTHYLSRSEYQKQKSIAKVYAQCDSTCHGGCYHGTLEAYLKERDQASADLNSEFPKICGKQSDYQKPFEFNECLHGLGHAAMFVYDMELKDSLKLCDTLPGQDPKERCYSGAFMENSSSSTSFDHASIYIRADDPFYPCNSLDEKYQPLCWQYQSSYFSIINHQDFGKVANMCLQIPSKYQDLCFKTIGTNQVGFTSSLKIMKQNCNSMPNSHFQNICVAGVISSLAYRFVDDVQKMVDFCSLVDSADKEICFRQLGTSLIDWSADKDLARENCAKIKDQEGYSWCMSVI